MKRAAMTRKGTVGRPGMSPNSAMMPAPMASARGCVSSSLPTSRARFVEEEAFVVMMPEVVAMMSDGICVTRPSPTVRIE